MAHVRHRIGVFDPSKAFLAVRTWRTSVTSITRHVRFVDVSRRPMSDVRNHDFHDPDLYDEPDSLEVDEPSDTEPADPAPEATPKFSTLVERGVHVITIDEAAVLDAYEVEGLGDDIYKHLETLDAPKVVIDVGNVEHLSSAALGMLIALRAVVEKDGGVLCVANVSSDLRSILTMTRLHKVIKIYDTLKEAIGLMA